MNTHTAAPASPELADTAADLSGYGPAAAKVVEGLMEMATAPQTAKHSSDLLILLGGSPDGDDFLGLIAAVAQHIGDPATNPTLRELAPRRAREIRNLTRQFAAYTADFAPRDLLTEAAGAADLDCPHPTDHA